MGATRLAPAKGPARSDAQGGARRLSPWTADVVGVAWVVLAALAVMTPALLHGTYLGPFDLLSQYGVTRRHIGQVHDQFAADQIAQMIPWTNLAWTEVHQGHLPLWNSYSGLGTPLAFNWQSAVFSLPALFGYLAPMKLAYDVQVIVTLLVAGTGAYFFARVMRCGVVASAFAAVTFELSGSFVVSLGWPVASVLSWAGWLFGAAILVFRGERRTLGIVVFAMSMAFSIYAGQPDVFVVLILALVLFLAVLFASRIFEGDGPILRPLVGLGVGSLSGLALAAPLLLPGAQLLLGSIRSAGGQALGGDTAYPVRLLGDLLTAGANGPGYTFNGVSVAEDPGVFGVIAVVLAIAAVRFRFRRPAVKALAAVAVFMGAVAFAQPVISVLHALPGLEAVRWPRALLLLVFSLAILSGVGMDLMTQRLNFASRRRWIFWSFAAALALVFVLVLADVGLTSSGSTSLQLHGLLWASTEALLGLVGVGAIALMVRSGKAAPSLRRWAWALGACCLACSTAFLVSEGGPVWSSANVFARPTAGVSQIQEYVGSATVGFGSAQCIFPPGLGIRVDANVLFGVHELAVYDPLLPKKYYSSWDALTHGKAGPAGYPEFSTFCPAITTSAIARLYGVEFVLEPAGKGGPSGSTYVARIQGESLYKIPDSGMATLSTAKESPGTFGRVVPVTHPGPASWRLRIDSKQTGTLLLRLSDVPGWTATIDGRPLALSSYDGVMMRAEVPAGDHLVELRYWPGSFTAGLVLFVFGAVLLGVIVVAGWFRRRRVRLDGRVGAEPGPS